MVRDKVGEVLPGSQFQCSKADFGFLASTAMRKKNKIKFVVCNYKTHGNLLQQPESCNIICHWDLRYIVNVVWHNKNIECRRRIWPEGLADNAMRFVKGLK